LLFEALSLILKTVGVPLDGDADGKLQPLTTETLAKSEFPEKQTMQPSATKLLKWIGLGISVLCGCGVVVVCVLGSPSVAIISSGSALLYSLICTGGIALGAGSFLIFHFGFQPSEIAVTIKKFSDNMEVKSHDDFELIVGIKNFCSQYEKCYDDVFILNESALDDVLGLQPGKKLANVIDLNIFIRYCELLSCVLHHLRKYDARVDGESNKGGEFIAIIGKVLRAEQFPSDDSLRLGLTWMNEKAWTQQKSSMKVQLTICYALGALQLGGVVPGEFHMPTPSAERI
jgi:hypothetical protein